MSGNVRLRTAAAVAALTIALAGGTGAEPLLAQGIGSSSCARLSSGLKPSEGLNDPVNLMLYAWVQGYITAANVALLEYDSKYVDMQDLSDPHVLYMIADYCKSNPSKKPANALDAYIKAAKKGKADWTVGTVEWD